MAVITVAGFVIGTAEALIYYNMGESKTRKNKKFTYKIPPPKELAKTAGIVMATSILTAGLTNGIEKLLEGDKPQMALKGFNRRRALPARGVSI